MLNLFKWIAGTLLTTALLVLAAVIIIPAVIDPNDYRDELTALVKEKTGREMRLEGDLSVSVFPWLGIRTQGLRFAQPESIGGDMLSVSGAQLRVRLLPLLVKRVEVDTVVLEQPLIRLVTLENGVDSWAGLLPESPQEKALELTPDAAQSEAASDQIEASTAAVALVIQGVRLTEGNIVLDDRQAGSRTEIQQLKLSAGNLIGGSLADFSASGKLVQADAESASGVSQTDFNLGARVKIDSLSKAAEVERLRAQLTLADQTVQLEVDNIAVSPQQVISLFGASINVTGTQSIQLSLPDATLNLQQQTLDAPILNATIANLNAVITDASVTKLVDAPRITGQLDVRAFNARKLLSELNIDYSPASAQALNSVALKAAFVADLQSVALRELDLLLDKSRVSGFTTVRDFGNPAMQFDLSLDSLNVDSYLPETQAPKQPAQEPVVELSGGEALAAAMAALYSVDANGRFRAQQLVASGVPLANVDVTFYTPGNNKGSSHPTTKPRISGRLETREFNARKLLLEFGVDYSPANAQALTAVSIKTTFVAGDDSLGLRELELMVDQSKLTGSASLQNFVKPGVKFDLSLDSLNLDEYLPAPSQSDQQTKQVSGGEALVIPMAAFHALNANGQFRAKRFVAGGVQLSDINVTVDSKDGNVTITPNAKLYQGNLGGKIVYQAQAEQAELRIQQNMDLVQLGELLTDADITNQLRGIGRLDVDVSVTERSGKQSNQGVIKLLASNGAVTGIDMIGLLSKANTVANFLSKGNNEQADSQANTAVQSKPSDVTQFGELIGTFELNDFQLKNDDLKLSAPGLRVTGFGTVDLASKTLDYNLRIAVQEGIDGVVGEKLAKLQGYTIPVRCRGSFAAPSCLPDMQALYTAYGKTKLDSKKGELLKQKYGIEGGEKLSTGDALKQILIQKALKKDKPTGAQTAPVGEPNVGAENSTTDEIQEKTALERPISERPITDRQDPPPANIDEAFSDVPVAADAKPASDTEVAPEAELNEKQKRRAERKKLLESLLNPDGGA